MASTIQKLYALKVPEIRRVFLETIQNMVDGSVLSEIEKAIQANDVEQALKACGFSQAVLSNILTVIEKVYDEAASDTVKSWPKRIGMVRPVYNAWSDRVISDVQQYSSVFVRDITNEMRETVRNVLAEGINQGVNPRVTALNLVGRYDATTKKRTGGFIGLSQNQTKWVFNAEKYLKTLDETYFNLSLRDKRFDKTVRSAIEKNKPLSAETVEKLVSAYKSKALKYRADAIARTETMQSINRGKTAAINQGIEEGLFKKENVKKWWDDTGDGRTRKSHRYLGLRYSKKNAIPIDEAFRTFDGDSLMFPGDTSLGADASEIIHCRCGVQYIVDFMANG